MAVGPSWPNWPHHQKRKNSINFLLTAADPTGMPPRGPAGRAAGRPRRWQAALLAVRSATETRCGGLGRRPAARSAWQYLARHIGIIKRIG
jgi:hypothetical protein